MEIRDEMLNRMLNGGGNPQPVLVFESKEGLRPHYLTDFENVDSRDKYNSGLEWVKSFFVPFDSDPFDPSDFYRVHRESIYHAGITVHTMNVFDKFVCSVEDVHRFLEGVFYYGAQSDAIGLRQNTNKTENSLILYQPELIAPSLRKDSKTTSEEKNLMLSNGNPNVMGGIDFFLMEKDKAPEGYVHPYKKLFLDKLTKTD